MQCNLEARKHMKPEENFTSARMQAVTPVPHEVTTGPSKLMPAQWKQKLDFLIPFEQTEMINNMNPKTKNIGLDKRGMINTAY